MTDEPIGVGLVGYGVSGSSLHAPLITAEPRLRLRAVVSSDPDRVRRDLPVRVVPAVPDLLADPAVELVVVAVPNEAHHEVAAAAVSAGRHVVVDKPFTVTTAEADDLIGLAESHGRLVAVFHQRRWDSDYLTVRQCVLPPTSPRAPSSHAPSSRAPSSRAPSSRAPSSRAPSSRDLGVVVGASPDETGKEATTTPRSGEQVGGGGGVLGTVNTYVARYDRYRPTTSAQWRERIQPGAGLLYDLGAHLIDQAVHLFGVPDTVTADVRAQRPGAAVDDYFDVVFGYGPLRVILHAGSLVPAPGPRFEVHGDAGSYMSGGIDGQIAALLAGRRPGEPGWGVEPPDRYGTLTTVSGTVTRPSRHPSARGAYETFYRSMADAVRGRGPVPVTAQEGRETVQLIERCLESSTAEGTLPAR
jgi:predicted dehydrogenase